MRKAQSSTLKKYFKVLTFAALMSQFGFSALERREEEEEEEMTSSHILIPSSIIATYHYYFSGR
jgi:hypothetical protein